jgi:hypothetical protein
MKLYTDDNYIPSKTIIDDVKFVLHHIISNNKIKNTNELFRNQYKIGDNVKISYITMSQKYFEYYENSKFIGKIIFIDNNEDDIFILCPNNCVKSTKIQGTSFMGHSNGYDMFIEYV